MPHLRLAWRQLAKHPGFALVSVLTLALGIGAATALFSVVHAVLISPYPYAHPERIWTPGLRSKASDQTMRSYRLDEFMEMSKLSGFAEVMGTAPANMLL